MAPAEVYGEVRQAWAEYVCVKVDKIGPKSPALSFEEAACLAIAGRTALEAIRDHERWTDTDHRYDLVLDLAGVGSFRKVTRMVTPTGRYVASSASFVRLLKTIAGSLSNSQVAGPWIQQQEPKNYWVLNELVEAGTVRPFIERQYAFEEIPQALGKQGQGGAQGKKGLTIRA